MTARARLMSAAGLCALLVASACASDDAAPAATDPPTTAAGVPATSTLETSELEVTGDGLAQLDDPSTDPAVGVVAPTITGQDFDGSSVTIGGAAGAPTLLVFLAHWCPHCNDEIPELNALRDSDALPADLEVVGISTAVAPDRDNYPPSEWVVAKDWTWPVLADSETADAFQLYGGSGFPFSVLLAADGTVLGRKAGSSSAAQIGAWIDSTLNPTS